MNSSSATKASVSTSAATTTLNQLKNSPPPTAKYKCAPCRQWRKGHTCQFGDRCNFCHDELRVDITPTEFCLFYPKDHKIKIGKMDPQHPERPITLTEVPPASSLGPIMEAVRALMPKPYLPSPVSSPAPALSAVQASSPGYSSAHSSFGEPLTPAPVSPAPGFGFACSCSSPPAVSTLHHVSSASSVRSYPLHYQQLAPASVLLAFPPSPAASMASSPPSSSPRSAASNSPPLSSPVVVNAAAAATAAPAPAPLVEELASSLQPHAPVAVAAAVHHAHVHSSAAAAVSTVMSSSSHLLLPRSDSCAAAAAATAVSSSSSSSDAAAVSAKSCSGASTAKAELPAELIRLIQMEQHNQTMGLASAFSPSPPSISPSPSFVSPTSAVAAAAAAVLALPPPYVPQQQQQQQQCSYVFAPPAIFVPVPVSLLNSASSAVMFPYCIPSSSSSSSSSSFHPTAAAADLSRASASAT